MTSQRRRMLGEPLPMADTRRRVHAAADSGHLHSDTSFPDAARIALGDSQLRRNLDHATSTIRDKRARVVAEVDGWEDLREAGKRIKQETMARLPELLAELEEHVTAAGGVVHWARDAAEATTITTRLVQASGSREVVKVKSMATQEIGLNEVLAEAGITAYETDLAELIVQLADDQPSHILVPAIHRNRAEIRDLFVRMIPGTDPNLPDDPRVLAATARHYLRKRFLTAGVGISGANFAVAETGTLAVVESEGNGRMCLTLPQTLITIMGVEKLVPRWADLPVFLELLPRSATGERMNPYTSLWTGVHAGDGPEQFHLVLLDNGRSAVLADPEGRSALHCIRCSACLNVCPVYERTGGHAYGSIYPGPIGAILTPQLTGIGEQPSLPYASSLCGACYDVCPVKIDIPSILVHLRQEKVEHDRAASPVPTPEAIGMAAASWTMQTPQRFERAQQALRAARPLGRRRGVISSLPPPLAAWTTARNAPRPPDETFREWWRRTRDVPSPAVGNAPSSPTEISAKPPSGAATDATTETAATIAASAKPSPADREPAGSSRGLDARSVVLRRLAQALDDDVSEPVPTEICGDVNARPAGHPTREDLIARFVERVDDYRATVVVVDPATLPTAIAEIVNASNAQLVAVPAGINAEWIATIPADVVVDEGLSPADLDLVDITLTASAVAIAETGTIVLDGSADQGRRALTLVPDHHVCVVDADTIRPDVAGAWTELDAQRPLTMISGPSATSDIELDRVEGVHGPRTLNVIVVRTASG